MPLNDLPSLTKDHSTFKSVHSSKSLKIGSITLTRKSFGDLRARVIEPIFKDLEECTLMNIKWSLIKEGRSFSGIQVIFKESEEALPPRGSKKTIINKSSSLKPITKAYIEQHARPGESYDDVKKRLNKKQG
jgi:hypothetical protein